MFSPSQLDIGWIKNQKGNWGVKTVHYILPSNLAGHCSHVKVEMRTATIPSIVRVKIKWLYL